MNWALLGQYLGLIFGGGALTTVANALLRRRTERVEYADRVNEMTIEWAAAVRVDAAAARAEAASARAEAAEARRQMAVLRTEIEVATARLPMWRVTILSPTTTLEELRQMARTDPDGNGQA